MGKSLVDTLYDILIGQHYMTRGTINRLGLTQIPEERLYVKFGIKNTSTCMFVDKDTRSGVHKSIIDKWKSVTSKEDDVYSAFGVYKCNRSFCPISFATAYKYVMYKCCRDEVIKWIKDKHVYYLGKGIVFDRFKRVMLSIGYNDYNNKILCIDFNVITNTDFLSKYIYSTFIPAFYKAYDGKVLFTSLFDCNPFYGDRYKNTPVLRNLLNDKLHNLAKVADF